MKFLCILLIFGVVAPLIHSASEWDDYKEKFKKNYSSEEDLYHQKIFHQNVEAITRHNARYHKNLESYKKGVNQFTDLSHEDRRKISNPFLSQPRPLKRKTSPDSTRMTFPAPIPDSFNWVERGAVTPIKDQKKCSSCYAFGSTVVFEAQYFLKTGTLRNLSEQNLLDCVPHNFGCEGGFPGECFEYVYQQGVMYQEDYSYQAAVGDFCKFRREKSVFPLTAYYGIESGDEEMITRMIATVGPVAVALDDQHFHEYAGGILDNQMGCNDTNHIVALVGYGTDERSGQEYYLAKNSWGDWWGEKGYVRIARNVNYCFMAENAITALL